MYSLDANFNNIESFNDVNRVKLYDIRNGIQSEDVIDNNGVLCELMDAVPSVTHDTAPARGGAGGEGVNDVPPADIENIDLPNINESYNEEVDELAVTGNIVSYFTYIFPFFTFFIKNPPKCASPYHYLQANFDTLKSEIETSEPFSLTHGHSLKIWITAWSYYVKLDRGLDGGMLNLVHAYRCGMVQNTVIHTTAYRLGFNTGKLSKKKFKKVINLVGSGFSGNEDCLNQSGWSYYKTVDIRICFTVISGKDMARTKPLQPIRQ